LSLSYSHIRSKMHGFWGVHGSIKSRLVKLFFKFFVHLKVFFELDCAGFVGFIKGSYKSLDKLWKLKGLNFLHKSLKMSSFKVGALGHFNKGLGVETLLVAGLGKKSPTVNDFGNSTNDWADSMETSSSSKISLFTSCAFLGDFFFLPLFLFDPPLK